MQPGDDIHKNWKTLREHGSPAALKFLFRHFYDPLFHYAARVLQREDLAKDAIQNTFADLWHYRSRLSPDVAVRAYLFRAVRNHCARLFQKHRPHQKVERLAQQLSFEPEELKLKEAPPPLKIKITEALNRLSPRQREIIYLKYYENLSYQEIAEVLQINYQSVVNHAHKAILRLRQEDALNFF